MKRSVLPDDSLVEIPDALHDSFMSLTSANILLTWSFSRLISTKVSNPAANFLTRVVFPVCLAPRNTSGLRSGRRFQSKRASFPVKHNNYVIKNGIFAT